MGKKTLFTNITPLPSSVSREVAVAMLHNHDEMIELNPMVVEHHPIKTPRDAPADEFLDCAWQELTDKVNYLPGGLVKGKVSYKACFFDMPNGLQTHIYAPTGLDIREKWSIEGTLPNEPRAPRELGSTAPATGLYLKEECEMRCNRLLNSFVRKNLDEAHKTLVERIMRKAQLIEQHRHRTASRNGTLSPTAEFFNKHPPEQGYGNGFQVGSHMSHSKILQSPTIQSPQAVTPRQHHFPPSQGSAPPNLADHPAFRNQQPNTVTLEPSMHNRSWSTNDTTTSSSNAPPSSMSSISPNHYTHQYHVSTSAVQPPTPQRLPPQSSKQFIAELQGSDVPDPTLGRHHTDTTRRESVLSEMSSDYEPGGTDRASVVSALALDDTSPVATSQYAQQEPLQQLPQSRYQYNPNDFVQRA